MLWSCYLGLDMERHPMRNAVIGVIRDISGHAANKLGTLLLWGGNLIEILQTTGGGFIGCAAISVMAFCIYAASYERRQNEVLRLKKLLATDDGTAFRSGIRRL